AAVGPKLIGKLLDSVATFPSLTPSTNFSTANFSSSTDNPVGKISSITTFSIADPFSFATIVQSICPVSSLYEPDFSLGLLAVSQETVASAGKSDSPS